MDENAGMGRLPMVLGEDGVSTEWVTYESVEALVATEEEKSLLRQALDAIAARAEQNIGRMADQVRESLARQADSERRMHDANARCELTEERERGLRERIGELRVQLEHERSRKWYHRLFG